MENKAIVKIATILLFLSIAVSLSGPLWDSDLWWHIATGKHIIQNGTLLSQDPFSFTSTDIPQERLMILNGYWLAQSGFYIVYSFFGDYGLIALRALVLLLTILIVFFMGNKFRASSASIIVLLVLAGLTARHFTGERPQLFSFLLAPIVFYILEGLRKSYKSPNISKKYAVLLILSMMLWANIHGGFMLGTALIVLYVMSEVLQQLMRREFEKKILSFCFVAVLAVLASLVNPNTYLPYITLVKFEGGVIQQRTSEYIPPLTLALKYGQYLPSYWIYLATSIGILLVRFKRYNTTHMIIMLFLIAISLSSFRYIPFFIFITLPITAMNLSEITDKNDMSRKLINGLTPTLVLVALIITIVDFRHSMGITLKHPIKPTRFPEKATEFIMNKSPSGNIFNHFNWGGYLIWKLYPDYKVFIDGRTLNPKALNHYTYMLWDKSRAGSLFDLYGIKTIIIPPANPFTGEAYELVKFLDKEKQWINIYKDETSLIYIRGKENQHLMNIYHQR